MENIDIKAILPHRYPFLLVDRIVEVKKNEYVKCLKNVSNNEPFFSGHFPEKSIFPGVLLIEALAQVTGIMYAYEPNEDTESLIGYLAGIKSMRFYRLITPGDQIILESTCKMTWDNIIEAEVTAYVGDELAAKGVIRVTKNDAQ
ncbi:3-hydroxyacyl-ACP dehydratase FabZ [Paenibacillus donghaensis]|uniref:3-hydroxyacyl-ACP dehydratase FabZ n=1 Tax=Paenibacillus donghaensis TaxID=414771 RepID=UPI0018837A72|nr:3-hydroxyacyl-ACP dehydratase FabZ [Paenibacillus donghaensis]MBE9915090.1 3-hydroxyacyl-ACP dehydratase FabZ [Paenibacillus donghaensis]